MITSAATDPFAAILASPGAAAPMGDAAAAAGGRVFGTMIAAPPPAAPVAAITPPSFRGALMNATLPVGALVSTGTPAAAPAVATLPWPGASPVMPTAPVTPATMAANAAPVMPATIPAGASPMALVPIVTAGPLPASVAPALPTRTDDASAPLPPATVRTMPAPAPAPGLRNAALVASLPAAWSPAPVTGASPPAAPAASPPPATLPTPTGAGPAMPLAATPPPAVALRIASEAGPVADAPLPAAPSAGSELPGPPHAPPVTGRLSDTSRSNIVTTAAPPEDIATPSVTGKPVLVAAPLPDLVLRTGPEAAPALAGPAATPVPATSPQPGSSARTPLPATPPVSGAEPSAPAQPALVPAPLPDLVLRAGPEAGPVLADPAADPVAVDAYPAVAAQPVDRATAPLPAATPGGIDLAKPSAPPKAAIAPAPMPMVFVAAPASPVVSTVAVKGPVTSAGRAPIEDGAPAEAEDTDPAATLSLPMTALPPVSPDMTTSPPPEATATPDASRDTDADNATHGVPVTATVVPAAGQPPAMPATTDRIEAAASSDRPAAVAAAGSRPVREETTPADRKPVTAATPDPRSFAALVEPKVAASAPAPTAAASPVPEARVAAEPGRMGHEMAVAIARHTAEGGGEALTVRLNPAEFGRIDVTLSFDDRGTLRAVLAAETPAALDLLRRDSADLGRALSDAGMRTDAQSFRFDTRQGGADAGGQGAHGQPLWQAAATPRNASATIDLPEPEYRPLRSRGGVDLMA